MNIAINSINQIRKNVKLKIAIEKKNRKPYYLIPLEERQLIDPINYQQQLAYALMFVKDNTIYDVRIVKTYPTLEKFIEEKHIRYGMDILLHPNPILLNEEFYKRYRNAKNGYERIKLFKDMKILTDENIFCIDTITIDIDSAYDESIIVLEKLLQVLQLDKNALDIFKTKSGNLRFSIYVDPLNPRKTNKNKRTNLENVKEFVEIVNNFFTMHGLKADKTFTRVNHPVWITKPQQKTNEATTTVRFYTLYSKAKKLKKQLQIKQTKRQRNKKLKLPAFILNRLQNLQYQTALEKATSTLYENSRGKGTYIHFLQVVAGWSKYLDLSYTEFYDLVSKHLIIDRKRERDVKTAWKHARPLEFKNKSGVKKEYDFIFYAERLLEYLEKTGEADRQTLIRSVFENQKWLEQLITEQLTEAGIIAYEYKKQEGKAGRPMKVFRLLKHQEKSSSVEEQPTNHCKMEFSHIITISHRDCYMDGRMVIYTPSGSETSPKTGKGKEKPSGEKRRETEKQGTREELQREIETLQENIQTELNYREKNRLLNQQEKQKLQNALRLLEVIEKTLRQESENALHNAWKLFEALYNELEKLLGGLRNGKKRRKNNTRTSNTDPDSAEPRKNKVCGDVFGFAS